MKITMKLLVIGAVFAVVLSVIGIASAQAQDTPITDQQIQQIRTNCVSAKSTLNQLHASDALLRVNRGQLYESMSTKLMDRFNTRASRNNFNNTGLVTVTINYGRTLDTFRTDYQSYEEQLSTALRIDCTKLPVEFYDAVDAARTKRNQVHADIIQLGTYIDQYRSELSSFETNYQRATQGATR
jgi:hypothetical protein